MPKPFSDENPLEKAALTEAGVPRRKFYFDQRLNSLIVWVAEGEFYVSTSPYEILSTVLGSCIAVCMRDPVSGCGGMNHFLLPNRLGNSSDPQSASLRFGSYSIERLVNELISRGARRERLEIKVFGGANMSTSVAGNHGHDNADFVERYLMRERLQIVANCLRGNCARRVRYHAETGRAQVRKVDSRVSPAILARELKLAQMQPMETTAPATEIFDPVIAARV